MTISPTVALRALFVGGVAACAKVAGVMKAAGGVKLAAATAAGGVKLAAATAAVTAAATAAMGSKQDPKDDASKQDPKDDARKPSS